MLASIVLMLLMLIFPQEQDNPLRANEVPLPTVINYTIAVNKTSYFIQEPIFLTMNLQNQTNKGIVGFFDPSLSMGNLKIYYRRNKQPFVKYSCTRSEKPRHTLKIPQEMKPSEVIESQEILLFNTTINNFILKEPGKYEIKAVYQDSPVNPDNVIESNTITFEVLPVPESEVKALEIYSNETLAKLLQADSGYDPREATRLSLLLIETYPDSIYTSYLHKRLVLWLEGRGIDRKLTNEEKQLKKMLKPQNQE